MKKFYFLLLYFVLFFAAPSVCDSQNRYPFENNEYYFVAYYDDLINPPFRFYFKESSFYLDVPELDLENLENSEYTKEAIEGNYLIEKQNNWIYLTVGKKKYLVLYYRDLLCILMDCSNNDAFFGVNKNTKYVHTGDYPRGNFVGITGDMTDSQKTSSFLREKISNRDIEYNNRGNYYYQLALPWIEGEEGDGIGEWIEKRTAWEADEIVFFNGFINPNRPDLFFANSRIKMIEIKCGDNIWEIPLEDTHNPQIVKLPEKIAGSIKFIIKDIYRGKKYSDTALAGIYFLREYPSRQ
jgi:hypothetical protein